VYSPYLEMMTLPLWSPRKYKKGNKANKCPQF
jgi:hypothetical protein